MKTFVCTDHDRFYPVGAASIVFAYDEETAQMLLDSALKARGLKTSDESPYTLREISSNSQYAMILVDGNY